MTQRIGIGTSPAGVEWNCWRKEGESRKDWEARADQMRTALQRHHERHTVKVTGLTSSQTWRIEDEGACVEGLGELKATKTTVRGSRALLGAVYSRLAGTELFDLEGEIFEDNEARAAMALRGLAIGIESACAKIATALGEREMAEMHRQRIERLRRASVLDIMSHRA